MTSSPPPTLVDRQWSSPIDGLDPNTHLTICTWNTLADSLALSPYGDHLAFPHTDQAILQWDYRSPLIEAELRRIDADILCLQEVDKYEEFFKPRLAKLGYASLWEPKINAVDGVLIAWKLHRFADIYRSCVPLHVDHSQISLSVTLRDIQSGACLTMCTTHLKSKPLFRNVRTGQAMCVRLHLWDHMKIERKIDKTLLNKIQFICGDFNDTPDALANTLFAQTGMVDKKDGGVAPFPWSTWKKRDEEVKRVIDYIFAPPNYTIVSSLLPPSDEDCPDRLPAAYYPSDHIAVAQAFSLGAGDK